MKGEIIVLDSFTPPPFAQQPYDDVGDDGLDTTNNIQWVPMPPMPSPPPPQQHQSDDKINMIAALAARDLKQSRIADMIRAKRAMLLKKQAEVDKKQKSNKFLKGVVKDYARYRDHIVAMKQQQLSAMVLLQRYVADLEKSEHTVGAQLYEARRDQLELTHEMDKLRDELEQLVGDQPSKKNLKEK